MPVNLAPSNPTDMVHYAARRQLSVIATVRLSTFIMRSKTVPQAVARGATLALDNADLSAHDRRYRTTAEEDEATIASLTAGPRQKVAARLLRIEKEILHGALTDLFQAACMPYKPGPPTHSVEIATFRALMRGPKPQDCRAGALQEVHSALADSDPVESHGPSVIPVRLS